MKWFSWVPLAVGVMLLASWGYDLLFVPGDAVIDGLGVAFSVTVTVWAVRSLVKQRRTRGEVTGG